MTKRQKKASSLKNRRSAMKGAQRAARILLNKQTRRMRAKGYRPVGEAAERVGLSVPRIYQLLNGGKLDGTREGSRRYVRWSALKKMFSHAFRKG